MSDNDRVALDYARQAALDIVSLIRDVVVRIEIAGSIRRKSPDVGDIELVAEPALTTQTVQDGFFDTTEVTVNRLLERIDELVASGRLADHPTDPKRGERYAKLLDPASGMQLDLFMVLPPQCQSCGNILHNEKPSGRDMRVVPQDLHVAGLPAPDVLRPELLGARSTEPAGAPKVDGVGPGRDLDTRGDHGARVRDGLPAGTSSGGIEGQVPGAPPRDGAAFASVPGAVREGAPPERHQERQPDREPADRDSRPTKRGGHLPSLSSGVRGALGPCPRCGSSDFTGSAQFGIIHLIRTGPAAFSEAFVKKVRAKGYHVKDGALHWGTLGCGSRPCAVAPTPEERDVFARTQIPFTPPQFRGERRGR